jgi:hypothetical protein
MNASTNASALRSAAAILNFPPPPSAPFSCGGVFFPDASCLAGVLNSETRVLGVLSIVLACTVCAMYVLVMVLLLLVHKVSLLWKKSSTRQAPIEPSDDPSKSLLQETKSSLRGPSSKADGKKKKKASFADENTSCAPARDVDEEDL